MADKEQDFFSYIFIFNAVFWRLKTIVIFFPATIRCDSIDYWDP